MSKLDLYLQWKHKSEKAQREADRVAGVLSHLKKELKSMGFDSVKEAEAELGEMIRQAKGIRNKLNKAEKKFRKKWKDVL